jgi:hypothetical protein
MGYIRQKGQAGTGELSKDLGVSPRTVNYCQKNLLIEGRLVREGKGKAAVYRLKEGPKVKSGDKMINGLPTVVAVHCSLGESWIAKLGCQAPIL